MSAPLVINLKDGSVWERRAVTGEGVALYALAGSCKCPEFVMATESELATLGIAGSADVLPMPVGVAAAVAEHGAFPMPVGPESEALSAERLAEIEAREQAATAGPWWMDRLAESDGSESVGVDAGGDNWIVPCQDLDPADAEFMAHARADVPDLLVDNARLRAQVAGLLAERHSPNESLDGAVRELRARQGVGCSCPPAGRPHQVGCPLDGVPVVASSGRPVNELTAVYMPVASLREVLDGEHWSTVHHDYRPGLGRDMPETGGAL